MAPKKQNASRGGAKVDRAGGPNATRQNKVFRNDSASGAEKDIIANKSTATEVQLEKAIALLRTGPKTTIQLRDHGIMMPAARIHHLRHVDGHKIASESVTLYDANGYRHRKCARYLLVEEAPAKEAP